MNLLCSKCKLRISLHSLHEMQHWNSGSDFMNLSKLLCEMDVNGSTADSPQELRRFALGLCCAADTSDGSKSETYLNFPCYRYEVGTSQEKAVLCHFWYLTGSMGNSRSIFPWKCWDTSTSSAKAILTADMNQSFSFGWEDHAVVLLSLYVYTAILQLAGGKCHLEAAAGMMETTWRWLRGCCLPAWTRIESREQCGETRWSKKETLFQAIFLEEWNYARNDWQIRSTLHLILMRSDLREEKYVKFQITHFTSSCLL